jgi:hypothetical protein
LHYGPHLAGPRSQPVGSWADSPLPGAGELPWCTCGSDGIGRIRLAGGVKQWRSWSGSTPTMRGTQFGAMGRKWSPEKSSQRRQFLARGYGEGAGPATVVVDSWVGRINTSRRPSWRQWRRRRVARASCPLGAARRRSLDGGGADTGLPLLHGVAQLDSMRKGAMCGSLTRACWR